MLRMGPCDAHGPGLGWAGLGRTGLGCGDLHSARHCLHFPSVQLMKTAVFSSPGGGATTVAANTATGGLIQANVIVVSSPSAQMGLCEVTLQTTSTGEPAPLAAQGALHSHLWPPCGVLHGAGNITGPQHSMHSSLAVVHCRASL